MQQTLAELRKYSHVNKKAMDQYVSFSEQRDNLVKRKEELDKSEKAIAELIDTLDMQKKEDIEFTLKGVAMRFKEVFGALTGGVGELFREKKYIF